MTGGYLTIFASFKMLAFLTRTCQSTSLMCTGPYAGQAVELNIMLPCVRRQSTAACWGPDWAACIQSVSVMDVKWYSQFNSLLNMLRTIFICAILAAAVFVFNRDASRLVLEPIERMLKKVKDVSENPLAVKQVPCCAPRAHRHIPM